MTSPEPVSLNVEQIVNKLDEISHELKGIREDQANLKVRRRRERKQFWVMVISLILDIALSVSLAFVAANEGATTDSIKENQARLQQTQVQIHDSQVASCEAGNITRLENKTYQLFFLQILAAPIVDQPTPTAREKAEIKRRLVELNNRLNVIYAPIDCLKRFPPVAPGPGGGT